MEVEEEVGNNKDKFNEKLKSVKLSHKRSYLEGRTEVEDTVRIC